MPSKRGKSALSLDDLRAQEAEESPEDEAKESPEWQHMEDELGIEMHHPKSDGDEMEEGEGEESGDEGAEGEDHAGEMGMDEEEENHGDNLALEHATDDELMAEIKKRGLMSKLAGHDENGPEEDHGMTSAY